MNFWAQVLSLSNTYSYTHTHRGVHMCSERAGGRLRKQRSLFHLWLLLRSQQALPSPDSQVTKLTLRWRGGGALSLREKNRILRDSWGWELALWCPIISGDPFSQSVQANAARRQEPTGTSPPRGSVTSAPVTLNPRWPTTELPRAPRPLTSQGCCGRLSHCSASFSKRLNFNCLKGCFFPHDFNSNNSLNIKTAAYTQSLRELITPNIFGKCVFFPKVC